VESQRIAKAYSIVQETQKCGPPIYRGKLMQFSTYVLNGFVAPKLSELHECSAPDVPEIPDYRGSLLLNQLLSTELYSESAKVLLASFIGRLDTAIKEYRKGRDHLMNYVGALPQHDKLTDFREALSHFEACILHAHIAVVSLDGAGQFLPGVRHRVYIVGDGSDYDRLRSLSNRVKHFDEDVAGAASSGNVPVAPLWITNEGLEARTSHLAFFELAEILVAQSGDAKGFAEDIFQEIAKKRRAAQSTQNP
jgi:hypothetical protein